MGKADRNYPRNCWWVAARSDEVGHAPFQRWLLDTPVVLFRRDDGSPVALDDRCPHRWAPLSAGYLDGDAIVCPYHGARFSADGQCSLFPLQAAIPATMRVRSFAVVERGPFIWIWMGDDAARDAAAVPPDFGWSGEPCWTIATGDYDFRGNYMFLHENVMDLTHFNYVHNKSFRFENWKPAPDVRVDGDRVQTVTKLDAANFNDVERTIIGLGEPGASHLVSDSWFDTPARHINHSKVYDGSQPPDVLSETRIAHLLTPSSPTSTHYWWFVGSSVPMSKDDGAQFAAMIHTAFLEDKVIIESIQDILEKDPRGRNYPEFSFKNDAGGVLVRRALDRILARE